MKTPWTSRTPGYCALSQKMSVPGSLPNSSMPGLMELRINLPNETPTYMHIINILDSDDHDYILLLVV